MGVFGREGEVDGSVAEVLNLLADVVPSQIHLLVVDYLTAHKPVAGVIIMRAYRGIMLPPPLQLIILNLLLVYCAGVPPPLQHLHTPSYLDQVGPTDPTQPVTYHIVGASLPTCVDQVPVLGHG